MIRFLLIFVALAGCANGPAEEPKPVEATDRGPAETLPIPDTTGIDFPTVFSDAMRQLTIVNTGAPWGGFATTIATVQPGCPDLWVGPPADDNVDINTDDPGLSWYDTCTQSDGTEWNGYAFWDTTVSVTGDPQSYSGETTAATRTLVGDGTVKDGYGNIVYSFDGEASDSIYEVEANGYTTWTWSSLVTGSVGGTDIFADTATPGGYRTDLYLAAAGGVADRVEARGDLYLFTDFLDGRFDSVAADLTLLGPLGAAPDACTLEPYGWIGVRDADAFWYDLVFLPGDIEDYQDPYANDPLGECDGCGTLYIRGVEQGQICVDLTFLFTEGIVRPPVADFIMPLHNLP